MTSAWEVLGAWLRYRLIMKVTECTFGGVSDVLWLLTRGRPESPTTWVISTVYRNTPSRGTLLRSASLSLSDTDSQPPLNAGRRCLVLLDFPLPRLVSVLFVSSTPGLLPMEWSYRGGLSLIFTTGPDSIPRRRLLAMVYQISYSQVASLARWPHRSDSGFSAGRHCRQQTGQCRVTVSTLHAVFSERWQFRSQ